MSKVVEYQIVIGYDPLTKQQSLETLTNIVQHRLREGWQPLGGVAVTSSGTFAQAMVKYE